MTATLEAGPVTLERPHTPVLLGRIVELLSVPPQPAPIQGVLVDATVGAGGHAAALLEASGPGVTLVGFDRDPDALTLAAERLAPFGDRATLVHARFDALAEHLASILSAQPLLGVLYDLGVSSMQLDRAERGFSFRQPAPLDMRMDPTQGPTAADLVNHAEPGELARLIAVYGEERHARRIANAIVRARPLATTTDLAGVVRDAVPSPGRNRRFGAATHPATRTFQALRIAVNAELDAFRASLPQALELARPAAVPSGYRPGDDRGGRVAVLAYHSLEDRIAKQAFAEAVKGCICPPDLPVCGCGRGPTVRLLTRGAEKPGPDEIARNVRARSARLRAVEAVGSRSDTALASPDAAER
ncbi:MAG: 16S rRNA (cytosine(1402)-N(4))-methyltransferase RsmH [Nitriliruptorales bacterium]|nr:16S rRNA (cytosine(1402)-N(4))-methyltransferase RsmH [Nitriliruptorales bacterium]